MRGRQKKILDMNLTIQGSAARNDFLYLMLKCLGVCVWNHDSATEEDILKKEKGGKGKWGEKPDSIDWCVSKDATETQRELWVGNMSPLYIFIQKLIAIGTQ